MLTAKEVSALLAQRAEDIAKYLFPNGKREGDEYRAGECIGSGQTFKLRPFSAV